MVECWPMERNGQSGTIDRELRAELEKIMDGDGIVSRHTELKVYECDGWTIEKNAPDLLLMPRTTAQVSAIVGALYRRGVAFVPRGAGTGLSGGCLPIHAPVMICTSRMNRIIAVGTGVRRPDGPLYSVFEVL